MSRTEDRHPTEPPRDWDRLERSYDCADCEASPATIFLPEGRYLCGPCWAALRELRQAVNRQSALRMRERTERIARDRARGRTLR